MVGPHFITAIAAPWGHVYNDSKVLQTSMTFLHFAALLFAGGYAVASDRWVLRARKAVALNQSVVLEELSEIHRPVIVGLGLLIITGSAMALADADTMLVSPVFWIKMGCFALLLLNGLFLKRAEAKLSMIAIGESADATHWWRKLGASAKRSMALWALTLFLGTLLTSAS